MRPYLVLGAGPTGLAMAKALAEAGIPYEQVEATGDVGGNWAHGVYETAHIISSRRTTEYTDFPMPADYPDFPSAAQMHCYFQDYAAHFKLYDRLTFHREVAELRPEGDRAEGGWRVCFTDGTAALHRGVIVCNGHHWARSFPPWIKDFTGEVLHSKDYKRPDQLRGKRVLVLGGGNSGCDLASEAARVGASADWSLRRGYWFVPKTLMGRPTVELMQPWLPVAIQRLVIKALIRVVVGDYAAYGLPLPDHDIFEAHPSVSTEVFHYLKHGRLTVRPDVASVGGRTVTFRQPPAQPSAQPSAPVSQEYDLIALGTGFDVAFPFLPEGTVPVIGKTPQLYAGMLRPEHRGLFVMGGYQVRYGIGPLLRPLAQLLADFVQLEEKLTVPLGELLRQLGEKPPESHLVDPHASIRRMTWGRRMIPVIQWRAARMGLLKRDPVN